MGYIGSQPATNFETVRKQVSTTNSGTTITLDYSVSSVQDILVTVNAVVQSYDNYSVSGTTLTLGGTLNNDRVEILYVGRTFQTVSPAVGTVTNDMLVNSSITLNGSAVSLGGSTNIDNTPYFHVNRTGSAQSLSDATFTNILYNNEVYDSGSCYDTANGRFTPNVAGYYFIYANPVVYNAAIYSNFIARFLLNGSTSIARTSSNNGGNDDLIGNQYISAIQYFNGSSDYVNVNIYLDVPSGSPEILNDDGKNYFGGYKLII